MVAAPAGVPAPAAACPGGAGADARTEVRSCEAAFGCCCCCGAPVLTGLVGMAAAEAGTVVTDNTPRVVAWGWVVACDEAAVSTTLVRVVEGLMLTTASVVWGRVRVEDESRADVLTLVTIGCVTMGGPAAPAADAGGAAAEACCWPAGGWPPVGITGLPPFRPMKRPQPPLVVVWCPTKGAALAFPPPPWGGC